jgi:hypothetical protein
MSFFRLKALLAVIISLVFFVSTPALGDDFFKVKKSFEVFKKVWVKKLYRVETDNFTGLKVTRSGGVYKAEYIGYGPNYRYQVKKTDSAVTPFIGVLRYKEIKYVSTGNSEQEVLKGPFSVDSSEEVKEIFRYTNGEWFY